MSQYEMSRKSVGKKEQKLSHHFERPANLSWMQLIQRNPKTICRWKERRTMPDGAGDTQRKKEVMQKG